MFAYSDGTLTCTPMFSTSCRGSSIRVYTSDSSCFLAPATCSSVTLTDLRADTTAPTALPAIMGR